MALTSSSSAAVLIGDLTLLRPLASAGIRTTVIATDFADPTLRSRYCADARVVPGFGEGAARTAKDLCALGDYLLDQRGAKTPLLFGTDDQLAFVYAHERELRDRYLFLVNDADLGHALLDKEAFSRLASEKAVQTPRTVSGREALDGALTGPLVVKPKRKTAWKDLRARLFGGSGKARTFANPRALSQDERFCADADHVVVQELIDHEPTGLLSFHGYADESSNLLASFVGRKLRTHPRMGGDSSYIELADDPAIDSLGNRVVKKLGLRGPFKIDIVRERDTGRDFVLEVNARLTLWSYLGAVSGVNLPAVACAHLEGRELPRTRRTRGYRWLNFYRDYRGFREDDSIGLGEWLLSLAPRRKVYETFAWSDPRPFASWCAQMVRAKVS